MLDVEVITERLRGEAVQVNKMEQLQENARAHNGVAGARAGGLLDGWDQLGPRWGEEQGNEAWGVC